MEDFEADMIFSDVPMRCADSASDGDGFECPRCLDMRDLVLRTEDQGRTSMCAAYTAASWIESVMWRKTGKPIQCDAVKLYEHARARCANPDFPGLSMTDVLTSAVELGMCPGCDSDDIVCFFTASELKRAVHRYGTCLVGMSITDRWLGHVGRLVMRDCGGRPMGGHAVICTGYNDVGVFIQNSWGRRWGKYGFACLTWELFDSQFMIGAYLRNCLDGMEGKR